MAADATKPPGMAFAKPQDMAGTPTVKNVTAKVIEYKLAKNADEHAFLAASAAVMTAIKTLKGFMSRAPCCVEVAPYSLRVAIGGI